MSYCVHEKNCSTKVQLEITRDKATLIVINLFIKMIAIEDKIPFLRLYIKLVNNWYKNNHVIIKFALGEADLGNWKISDQ